MHPGEERLCGNCESKLPDCEEATGLCSACAFGEGFQCERALSL